MLNRLFGAIPSMTSSRDSRKRKLRDLVDLLSLQNQPTQIQHKSKPAVHSWLNSNGWLWRCLVFQVEACLQACGWQIHVTQIFAWKPRSKEANYVPSKISTDSWIKRGNVLSDGCSDLRTSLMTKAGALYQLANWPIGQLAHFHTFSVKNCASSVKSIHLPHCGNSQRRVPEATWRRTSAPKQPKLHTTPDGFRNV